MLWAGASSYLYTLTSSSLSKWDVDDSWEHQVLSWDARRALTESIADTIWVSRRTHVITNTENEQLVCIILRVGAKNVFYSISVPPGVREQL